MEVTFGFHALKFFTCSKDEWRKKIQKLLDDPDCDRDNVQLEAMYLLFDEDCDWITCPSNVSITGYTEETVTAQFNLAVLNWIDIPEDVINNVIETTHAEFEGDEYLEKCALRDRFTDIFKQYYSEGLSMWTCAELYTVFDRSWFGDFKWEW